MVALYGAFNEILAGMGMADRIVARTEADTTPPSIAALPVIGTHMRPNLERVLAVKPDLVLQMAGRGEAEQAVEALSRLGVPVAVFSVTDFPGLYAAILRIGTLTGAKEAADSLVAALQERLAALVAKAAGKARSKVFFEVRSGSLLAAGKGSMVDAVIAVAGGENAVTAGKKIVRLADEELLRLAPDVCLTQRGPMNPEARPMTERPEYAALPCVKNGRAFLVDEALYSRPGPGSVDAAEALATLLAGDAKKEARP
ncbi:ABC transporter substrate-binding protein [Solidesulfovibrio sp.]|uniref:ABC transporter substrate-binding protein n=1 Tax=Solidesulfovibrio sp. TaxID=2910990 RepID=UPI002B1EB1AB|nr:ABC transporter substrate-binding protein [Solidesulfovibrio sp.]MEA5089333.1 ABC transporter substrate-binding protein [Solidesulfovibrio sp.]